MQSKTTRREVIHPSSVEALEVNNKTKYQQTTESTILINNAAQTDALMETHEAALGKNLYRKRSKLK